MSRKSKLKPISIVIFEVPKKYESEYELKNGEHFLFLGEIKNMPGHCAIVDIRGLTHFGYHTDDFRLPTDDEL